MNYKLSLAEQETIINWDNELDTAGVNTHDARLIRRLQELEKQYPKDFVLEKSEGKGVTYRIPKRLVSIRAPYSEERRQHDREIALAQGRKISRSKTEKAGEH